MSALISFHHTTSLPQWLVSDLDGTLLTPRHTISRRTAEALSHAQRAGISIMIASGRSPRSIQKVIDLFNGVMVPDAVLCCNGALVYDPKTKVISHPLFLPLDQAVEIVQTLKSEIHAQSGHGKAGFSCEVVWIDDQGRYSNDTHFVCDGPWELQRKHSIYYDYTVVPGSMEEFLASLVTPEGKVRGGVVKLMALDRDKEASVLYESIPGVLKPPHAPAGAIALTYSGPFFVEMSACGVNKGLGLQTFCEGNGVPREKVVAFGDLLNDAEMLQYAGLGLCMRNGHEDVKKLSDRVVGTNAEDGVAGEVESWFDLLPSVAALAPSLGGTPFVED
ncbi:hypothetical protein HDU98_007738 [Podochytrium sp. JEL0797]|nr:hypothetical protein HDU98_007738 [Podochytrium sp. JEL0797]